MAKQLIPPERFIELAYSEIETQKHFHPGIRISPGAGTKRVAIDVRLAQPPFGRLPVWCPMESSYWLDKLNSTVRFAGTVNHPAPKQRPEHDRSTRKCRK
jgi:hypothetical protein